MKVLTIPYKILFPLILLFCLIGSYGINNSEFDVVSMVLFGILGYVFRKLEYEPAPLVLAFVLGKMMEKSFRQALSISNGSFWIFWDRPIAAICIFVTIILFITSVVSYRKGKRESLADGN